MNYSAMTKKVFLYKIKLDFGMLLKVTMTSADFQIANSRKASKESQDLFCCRTAALVVVQELNVIHFS